MAIPSQNTYIEVPYRNGVLFFTATTGPEVNLSLYLRRRWYGLPAAAGAVSSG